MEADVLQHVLLRLTRQTVQSRKLFLSDTPKEY